MILNFNNISNIRLDVNEFDFWEKAQTLDFFIYKWGVIDHDRQVARSILPVIENEMNIPCLPNIPTSWHYDDKIKQYYLLKTHGCPVVPSWIFYNKEAALNWALEVPLPIVFKLSSGASSENVVLLHTRKQVYKIIHTMFRKGCHAKRIPLYNSLTYKQLTPKKLIRSFLILLRKLYRGEELSRLWQVHKGYVFFQQFLPHNDYTTRIAVIGNRAFAYRRINLKNDFRVTSNSGSIFEKGLTDLRCVKIAFEISKSLKFQSMGYDFIFDEEDNPQVCDISYLFPDWKIFDCPGYWDENLNWHDGHYWPQYCQLMDFLSMPGLKQPNMNYK